MRATAGRLAATIAAASAAAAVRAAAAAAPMTAVLQAGASAAFSQGADAHLEQQQQPPWTPAQQRFMRLALEQAREALRLREVPIGCVFVRDEQVIGAGFNLTNHMRNATRHAELEALDRMLADAGGDAGSLQFQRVSLYVTIEPCIMCAAALSLLGLAEVVYGAANDKFGGCGSILDVASHGCGSCGAAEGVAAAPHGMSFACRGGLFADEAIQLLQDFYIAGNPAAPKPHRRVMDVPPWEQQQLQQQQQTLPQGQQDRPQQTLPGS